MSIPDLPSHLYAAVLAQLDDDAPRLACADWFERNGQRDRGEFIRHQCEAAQLSIGDFRGWQVEDAADQLLWPNRRQWLGDRPELPGVEWEFLRGFPEQVIFNSFKALHEHRAEVFCFFVRRIGFRDLRSITRLATSPLLAQVPELDLSCCNLRDEGVRILAGSPHLGGLTWLDLGGNGITAAGIEALVEASLPALTHLELTHLHTSNRIGLAGARALANWASAAKLRYLGVRANALGDEGLIALAPSPNLASLQRIDLGNNGLTRAGVAALSGAACWPALRELLLPENRLGDEGGCEIAWARHWVHLATLDLSQTGLGDASVAALAGAVHLTGLATLIIGNNAIGDAGATALANSPHLTSLQTLDLRSNMVGDPGSWALGRSSHLPGLRTLRLYHNAMRPVLRSAVEARFTDQDPSRLDDVPVLVPAVLAEPSPPPPLPRGTGPIDEEALWQAIVDDPDDDVARLIYADWLEEHGESDRAELIRLQCDPDRRAPSVREQQLCYRGMTEWLGPLAGRVAAVDFERGLIRVSVSMSDFLLKAFQQNGPSWLRQARVGGLALSGTTRNWQRVADSPVLSAVHELQLAGREVGVALPVLAGSPHLAGLHTLRLFQPALPDLTLSEFLASAQLPRLRRLHLVHGQVGLLSLTALLGLPQTTRLTTLVLRHTWITTSEMAVLSNSAALANLRHLDLSGSGITDVAVRPLVKSAHLTRLVRLDLNSNQLGDEGAVALANSPTLGRLVELNLTGNPITEEGIRALANSPHLASLRRLSLWLYQLPETVAEEVRRLFGDRWQPGARPWE